MAMERTISYLVLVILVWICAVDGQTCRPNAPRRDCGKLAIVTLKGFPVVADYVTSESSTCVYRLR